MIHYRYFFDVFLESFQPSWDLISHFCTSSEKQLSFVLKELSLIEPNIIVENPINLILWITKFRSNRNSFIYRINFLSTHNNTIFTQIRKISFLLYFRSYWEKYYKNKNYTQRFRCQAYGHASFLISLRLIRMLNILIGTSSLLK